MTTPSPKPARWTEGFGVRLGMVLSLAILPVGVMGVMQSADLVGEARARSEAALAGETLRAVRPALMAIQQAQGAAQVLAAAAQGDCSATLDRLVAQGRAILQAGLYAMDGTALCISADAPVSFAAAEGQARLLTEAAPAMALLPRDGGGEGFFVLHPRTDEGGRVTGFAAVAPRLARDMPFDPGPDGAATGPESGFELALFDSGGQVLGGTRPRDGLAAILPAGRSLGDLHAADVATFTAATEGGDRRAYSLIRLVEGELYALGSWPVEATGLVTLRALPALAFPVLMWLVSLIAAWAAAETLVTRHIRRLRSAIMAFAGGDRAIAPLHMAGAPREIRETAEAFERMTETILHDEAHLEDSVHRTEILLREVHHRVKNNLQLIASIMNMQIRRTTSAEARAIIRSLQDRMLGLATIHNGLYQTSDLSELAIDKLFPGIIEQVVRGTQPRGGVRLQTEIEAAELPLDRAVPLALLLTEALSAAMRHATAPPDGVPVLSVTFRRGAEDMATLEVVNSAADGQGALDGSATGGIGTHLMRGFARQLGGQFHREFADGLCRVRLVFPLQGQSALV
ncbi:MAG: hypothetical protein RIR62_2267 [Pseudomonadota bacterium]